jgi:hypothetical protein
VALLVILTLFPSQADAKPSKYGEHSFSIGVEPLWLGLRGLGVHLDRRMSQTISLAVAGMYIPMRRNFSFEALDGSNYRYSVYEIYVGPTFMFNGDYEHSGFYLFPAVGYFGASIRELDGFSATLETIESRVTGGYQFVRGFAKLTVGAGMRFMNPPRVTVKDESTQEVERAVLRGGNGLAVDLRLSLLF